MKALRSLSLLTLCALSSQAYAIDADFYGFIKASFVHTDNSVASYGADSIQGPTEAANSLATATQEAGYRMQSKDAFQVAQSRFGFNLKKNDNLTGKIEFDFVDFTNHPVAKNDARLRIVEIAYKFSPEFSLRIGQGWSTFAGITTHSLNYIGGAFRSGGSGFLAQQAELKYTKGNLSFIGAIGQKGRNTSGYNNGATATATEQDVSSRGLPEGTLKIEYNDETQKIGAVYTQARFDYAQDQKQTEKNYETESYGGKVYYQGKFKALEVRSELYIGSNLQDIYALTLAERAHASNGGQKDRNFEERGGYLSLKYNLEGGHAVYGGAGLAEITSNIHDIGDKKILRNSHMRLGYSHLLEEGLSAFVEGTRYETGYKKGATGTNESLDQAIMLEAGLNYAF